jgi:hypothetical protein
MRNTQTWILAGAALIAAVIVPMAVRAEGSCCAATPPTEAKKCAACEKCGSQECKCTKTATTNACPMAAAAKCEAPKPAETK